MSSAKTIQVTREQLMERLAVKLQGKPVMETFRRLQSGSLTGRWSAAKVFSSLLTHAIIECEQGNDEFQLLVAEFYEKLGPAVFRKG